MDFEALIQPLIQKIKRANAIEGAYLSGSLVNENRDDYSDIDLGIATRNTQNGFDVVWALRKSLARSLGKPINYLERGWMHTKLVAVLFSRFQFPPIGLELDIVFSMLKHVGEQMPYSAYRILLDDTGRLGKALKRFEGKRPRNEATEELKMQTIWFPFYVFDATKALRRGDQSNFQSMLDEMRKCVFNARAIREGVQVYGAKRGLRYLKPEERRTVLESYRSQGVNAIRDLAYVYSSSLADLSTAYDIKKDAARLKRALSGLL